MTLVLVAEDSPSVRLLLLRRLEMADHDVREAGSGTETLAAVLDDEDAAAPDIVLLDATMPDADGADVLNAMKSRRPGLPVIVISGRTDLANLESWKAADGIMSKPIDFENLLRLIAELTSGRPRP